MNALVNRFFLEDETFDEVVILTEQPDKRWRDIEEIYPHFPRSWFELSRVSVTDRVEFTRDFWLKTLPYHPAFAKGISEFFAMLDDVGVVLSRQEENWTAQLVYSLSDNSSFFRGLPPAQSGDLLNLQSELNFTFPCDWISFLGIHNGFGKLSEFGLLPAEDIPAARRRLMETILRPSRSLRCGGRFVDAGSLVPFYEVFGLNSFQCFFSDWYPNGEMGNVYFSGIDYTLSDTASPLLWNDGGAHSSFLEWLISYLEGMNIVP